MNLVTKSPRTLKKNDIIWVMVELVSSLLPLRMCIRLASWHKSSGRRFLNYLAHLQWSCQRFALLPHNTKENYWRLEGPDSSIGMLFTDRLMDKQNNYSDLEEVLSRKLTSVWSDCVCSLRSMAYKWQSLSFQIVYERKCRTPSVELSREAAHWMFGVDYNDWWICCHCGRGSLKV